MTKIVVSTDFSALSESAIDEAVELARPHGAKIFLVHVVEETDYPLRRVLKGHGILDVREQMRKGVQDHLERLRDAKLDESVPSTTIVRDGLPSATIADVAEDNEADVVVMATHARKGLARFFLGRTAERVVRVAPCSVLVVKPPRE